MPQEKWETDRKRKHKKRKITNTMDIEILVLDSSNSLLVANTPRSKDIDFGDLADKILQNKKTEEGFEKFGLFETATPNFATYYPGVSMEDLVPQEGDFIHPVFRALSETTVKGNLTDFSKNGVLKKSMSLLKGQTIYANHDIVIGSHLGVIEDVRWQESYKLENGLTVPAGINTKLKIDGKSQPNIARAILMDPPALHSVSVTIQFEWEQSHPKLTREEFWSNFGQLVQGEVVRKVATKILRYYEISLVPHGADPFAKKLDEGGKIISGNIAKSFASFGLSTRDAYIYGLDFKNIAHELNSETIPKSLIDKEFNKMDLTKLATKLGLSEATEEAIEAKLTEVISNASKIEGLNTQIQTLTGEATQAKDDLATKEAKITELNGQITTLTVSNGESKKVVDAFRAKVVENYTKLKGDNKDEAMLKLLADASYDTLVSLNNDYLVQLEEKFPLTCKDCNSHNIDRSSGSASGNENNSDITPKKTLEEIHKEANKIVLH